MYIKLTYVLLLTFLLTDSSLALTGTEVNDMCTSDDPKMQKTCEDYLSGVIDAAREIGDYMSSIHGVKANIMCVPENLTIDELKVAVVKYYQKHPDNKVPPAPMYILDAVALSYPNCE